jgi:hypothetical protein
MLAGTEAGRYGRPNEDARSAGWPFLRPIERTARWAGKEKEFRALVRSLLGIEERW